MPIGGRAALSLGLTYIQPSASSNALYADLDWPESGGPRMRDIVKERNIYRGQERRPLFARINGGRA